MQSSLIQKLFVEASAAPNQWLPQLIRAAGADAAHAQRAELALKLFAELAPSVEQEAFARADARLRDYDGTPFAQEQRGTLEAMYVSAAYSKLALAVAVLTQQPAAAAENSQFDI
ncbi:hypothetical protein JST97_28100 [bacterium]|nr:hypothetical protein [bacterium]